MRRRIIRQGNNSYTVTLPIKWIRNLELNEGDEISIEEKETSLIMSPETIKKKRETTINIEDEYEKNIRFLLNEVYRLGYDKININTKNNQTIEIIQKQVEELFFDMEVMDKEEKSCILEVISEPNINNYNSILKKMFFIIKESNNNILDSNKIKEIKGLTEKYRKYDNFCRRFVITYVKTKESFSMYSLLVHLLMIQTDLNRVAEFIIKNKAKSNILFKSYSELYNESYNAFIRKDKAKLYSANKKINQMITAGKKIGKTDMINHYCLGLLRILYSTIVPMIGMLIEEENKLV